MSNFYFPLLFIFGALALEKAYEAGHIPLAVIFWVLGIGSLFGLTHVLAKWALSLQGTGNFTGFMKSGAWAALYRSALTAVLDRFDNWLCPP